MAFHWFIKHPSHTCERVEHKVFSNKTRQVCQTFWKKFGLGIQQQTWSSDTVASYYNHLGILFMHLSVGAVLENPGTKSRALIY